jgi:redox-sensitive bicupin YhaK (pirin superfamily)
MIELRPPESLFHVEGGWFSANWHFSFDTYHDPANTQFGDLRVFNDDRLIPGAIWPMHPHRDIEGITYVAEGTFKHADSMGNDGILPPGSVQRATLGSGMMHSEQNGSATEPMRFIQMWIMPARRALPPSVEQVAADAGEWERRRNALVPVMVPAPEYAGPDSPAESPGTVTVHQDAALHAAILDPAATLSASLRPWYGGYLFVVHGALAAVGDAGPLAEGGAAKIAGEARVDLRAGDVAAELLMVETRLVS